MAAIKLVAERLAESEDVDMAERGDASSMDELSVKFAVQGTSSSKTSGKKKVVSITSRSLEHPQMIPVGTWILPALRHGNGNIFM